MTMIKRKDGSYSKRGLWDNIRANKGSGKKPTKEMLKQEKKIKNENKMGGKRKMYGGMKKNKLRKKQGGGFMDKARNMAMRGDEAVRNLPGTISKGMSSMAGKARSFFGFKKGGFPDLSGDGKITQKDILMGRGVIGKKKKQMGGPKAARLEKKRQKVEKKIGNAKSGSKREDRLYDKELKLMQKSGKASKKYKAKKKMMGGKKNMYQTGGFLEPGIENIDNL
jgi:hypothetical protein